LFPGLVEAVVARHSLFFLLDGKNISLHLVIPLFVSDLFVIVNLPVIFLCKACSGINMPKCIVIGDDLHTKQNITGFIEKQPGWIVASGVTECQEAATAIRQCQPDVCFMDISFDGRCDIESVREMLGNYKCLLVFISSNRHFAANAFELDAVDYVLKPITPNRLMSSLQKIENQLCAKQQENTQKPDLMSIADSTLVDVDDIFWIGESGDHLELHCRNKMWLCRDAFATLERRLDPEKFVRVQRSTMVNIKKVSQLMCELDEFSLLRLSNGDELKIEQRHRTPLLECLGL
jgi:DNA-binding LytR/AlgR family response regulator